MKKTLMTAVALVMATSAYATDLPNKKNAPAAPAATTAAPAQTDSLTASYGQDLGTNFGSKVDDIYQLTYSHNIGGGVSVGGMAQTTQVPGSQLNQNLEAQAGYALPAFAGVVISGKAGIGERFTTTNFPYYAVYGNADYKLGPVTINAVQYRFRSAIDSGTYGYQSHQIGTGVTYNLTDAYSVSGKIARNYDTAGNGTGDVFMVGFTAKF